MFYPSLSERSSIGVEQLAELDEPCVIFEGEHRDSDGVIAYVYTVGGFLAGAPVGGQFGALVGGEAILVHAHSRADADGMASEGLAATIAALIDERRIGIAERAKGGVAVSVDSIGKGAMH